MKYRQYLLLLLLPVFVYNTGCVRSANPDVERGSFFYFQDGYPEVRMSSIGLLSETDEALISVTTDIVVGSLIYSTIDDVRQAMTGLLEPITKEQVIGHAEVRQLFQIGKRSQVAGCMVSDGRAQANAAVRVKRGEDVLFEGRVASLKRFQNDASEIRAGQECGIRLDRFSSFEVGDTIEFYVIEKITPEL